MQYSIDLQNKSISELVKLDTRLKNEVLETDEDRNPDLAQYLKSEFALVHEWLHLRIAEREVGFAQSKLREIEHSRSGAFNDLARRVEDTQFSNDAIEDERRSFQEPRRN